MTDTSFWIGLDDTDSPEGMCTTWLGALLIKRLRKIGYRIQEARLIRLNPTIPHRTRGNAAIAIRAIGDPGIAFNTACDLVSRHADLVCEKTHPGVVVADHQPPAAFYTQAVSGICTIEEARDILNEHALFFRGYKLGRGLIGATAAIASALPDHTWEILVYRDEKRIGTPRYVDTMSLFTSEEITTPHTWDTVDRTGECPVCIPHTPDPVLFGIRGDTPFAVAHAASCIRSESPTWGQIWLTNQGTDAHLIESSINQIKEGHSYRIQGTIQTNPVTLRGGHVQLSLTDDTGDLTCMAFEPTKEFRHSIRSLIPGDQIIAVGSYLSGALNLEKICLIVAAPRIQICAPICEPCAKQMTSAGSGKGYKCRRCKSRSQLPSTTILPRDLMPGWYEVPPCARRHLAKPIIRDQKRTERGILPGSS